MNHALSLHPPILLIPKNEKLTIFWTLNLIIVLILLITYILQIGLLTKEIYLIQDYQKRLHSLSKENEILEINFSKSNSLSNIETYLSRENFIKTNQVKYIQILESSVVRKP